jgi:hypothetical protein
LHELAAAKHRSAGDEDEAKGHDAKATGHGDEIQAHKGVIEACGGVAARGNGAAGLEASDDGDGGEWATIEGRAVHIEKGQSLEEAMKGHGKSADDTAKKANKSARESSVTANASEGHEEHYKAAAAHEAAAKAYEKAGNKTMADVHRNNAETHKSIADRRAGVKASDATPAAGLQLDCSACVEAKNFKSVLNPIADGIIMYMPSGTHTITPSQNGRPVTVAVAIDASAAEKLETQRQALEAGGKKPFFSVQHSTQIAAFWPAEFFWDTRLDATGSLVEGVWARGEWTRAGREAVEGKDFRTFSPTFFVDAIRNDPNRPVQVVCNDEAKANMGALENDPAFQTISPLWCHDSSAPGNNNNNNNNNNNMKKPDGISTGELVRMVHDELRASNPDLQDVVNAMSFKYDMRVSSNDVARALRGEALEARFARLEASNPEGINQWTKGGNAFSDSHKDTASSLAEGYANNYEGRRMVSRSDAVDAMLDNHYDEVNEAAYKQAGFKPGADLTEAQQTKVDRLEKKLGNGLAEKIRNHANGLLKSYKSS